MADWVDNLFALTSSSSGADPVDAFPVSPLNSDMEDMMRLRFEDSPRPSQVASAEETFGLRCLDQSHSLDCTECRQAPGLQEDEQYILHRDFGTLPLRP